MPFESLDLAGHAVKPSRQRRFQPIGPVRREMRGERGFDDKRLRHVLARSVIGEPAGELRRQAERVLGAHARGSEAHIVGWIEARLAGDAAGAALKDSQALRFVVAFVISRIELARRPRALGRDLLVLG